MPLLLYQIAIVAGGTRFSRNRSVFSQDAFMATGYDFLKVFEVLNSLVTDFFVWQFE